MQTLQFGIIGLGHFGKHYVRLLQEIPGVNLVKTSNTSVETDEIINNREINCVVIASPPSTHCELIIKALRAGKHVLVEKPMVLGVAEAKKVKKELDKNKNLIFMVGFQYVYNDHIRYIKEHIDELGKVGYMMGANFYCGPLRADVGSFADAGVHDLAVLEYLFSPGKIAKVVGVSRSFTGSTKDDFTTATVIFKKGLTVNILTSWYWPEKVRKVVMVGDKGMVLFNDRGEEKLKWVKNTYPALDREHASLFLPGVIDESSVVSVNANEPLKNELQHFIECVNTSKQPLTGIEFGTKVTEMMEEISKRII